MTDMLINNHKANILGLMEEGKLLLDEMKREDMSREIGEHIRLLETKESPTVMFYGMYNAGKSTLINAICKKRVAVTGDIPTTASVQTIPWDGYDMIDTPGINAREEHTRIAVNELDRTDLVLFVVDNSEGFERNLAADEVIHILMRGKAVAVVINQKNIDEEEDPNIPVYNGPLVKTKTKKFIVNHIFPSKYFNSVIVQRAGAGALPP